MFPHLKKTDWFLTGVVLLLSGVGLLTIYKIGSPESFIFFKRQLIFLGFGLLLMFLISFSDYRIFKNHSSVLIALYLVSLFALGLVLFSPEIRGSSSWFKIGSLSIEPIEFAKIVIILLLAKFFSLRHIELYRIRHMVASGIYISLPAAMVLLQPDFGSVLVLGGIWLGIVFLAGIGLRHFIILMLLGLIFFGISWFGILEEYQKERVLNFLNPEQDPYGGGYHISQSLIAVGSGGILGRAPGASTQAGLKFLPDKHTDFIFATFAEQRGVVGVLFLLILFGVLFWRIIKIALLSSNNFSRLFASGIAVMIFIQLIINIGMNIGILPITGLTLPFVSYGGSSLVSTFIGMGILQSIKIRS